MNELPEPSEQLYALDAVAGAIADPVRREILVMLRAGPCSAGGIARQFTISRPAVSRHLRVLREGGLVRDESVGRRRLYALDASRFAELEAWLGQFARPVGWEHRLDALGTEVRRTRRDRERDRARTQDSDRDRDAHTTTGTPQEESA